MIDTVTNDISNKEQAQLESSLATHVNQLLTGEKFAGLARILHESGFSENTVADYFKNQKFGDQALVIEMDVVRRSGGAGGILMELAMVDDNSMRAGLLPIESVVEYMERGLAQKRQGQEAHTEYVVEQLAKTETRGHSHGEEARLQEGTDYYVRSIAIWEEALHKLKSKPADTSAVIEILQNTRDAYFRALFRDVRFEKRITAERPQKRSRPIDHHGAAITTYGKAVIEMDHLLFQLGAQPKFDAAKYTPSLKK